MQTQALSTQISRFKDTLSENVNLMGRLLERMQSISNMGSSIADKKTREKYNEEVNSIAPILKEMLEQNKKLIDVYKELIDNLPNAK